MQTTPRERYLEALTFGQPERVPLMPGGPRESTLAAWHSQGLASDKHYLAALSRELGLPIEAFSGPVGVDISTRMLPTFEERVLEHRDGHYIVQDWMGAITEISDTYDYTYIRTAKDFVTRRWHRFPVESPADWEVLAWRYDGDAPERYPVDPAAAAEGIHASGCAAVISINGPFWQMREWMGMEGLCLAFIEQPEFIAELCDFWQRFTCRVLTRAFDELPIDVLQISADLAYKAHSMLSPAMTRRYLLPVYRAWVKLAREAGVRVIDMDSDGEVSELIPIWIEAGINVCDPMEVAAGNDIVAARRTYGTQMGYRGGLDKRALAAGGSVMRTELERVVPPLLETGGFIPSCDHGVPPDISWPDFIAYTRYLAELLEWL